jgi:hypothetical protein
MRDVAIAESRLDAASALSVNPARGEVSLAAAGTDTVIAGRSGAGGRVVACSFRPTDTAWSMQATFAVFVHNAVDWLAAARRLATVCPEIRVRDRGATRDHPRSASWLARASGRARRS